MLIDPSMNTIVCGDNLEWLHWLPDGCVDLCYIDPPFFSNRNYEVIWGNGYELRSFGDRFAGGVSHYIEWMRERIALIHRKLKPTGAIFLHCDWHASHRLRVLLDEAFGEQNFINEIIWKRKLGTGPVFRRFSNNHDTIFFYSKSSSYRYEKQFTKTTPENLTKKYNKVDKDGRRFHSAPTDNPAYRPNLIYGFKGYKSPTNGWRWTKERMNQLDREGRLLFPRTVDGRIRLKLFEDEAKGDPVSDIWDDTSAIQSQSNERLGYPTQKPEALIRRIIECASNPGDLVLDCFAGGGTTAKVASDTRRRFVVGDVSPVAVKLMAERLNRQCPKLRYEVRNLPQTVEEFQQIDGHKFAEIVCELSGWEVNTKKSGDRGIDGFDAQGNPIQIKNRSESSVGRPDIQKFHSAIKSAKKKRGVFVSWSFAKTAHEYIAEIKSLDGTEIIAKQCSDVFGDLILPHDKAENIKALYRERFPEVWSGLSDTKAPSPAEQMNDAIDALVLSRPIRKKRAKSRPMPARAKKSSKRRRA